MTRVILLVSLEKERRGTDHPRGEPLRKSRAKARWWKIIAGGHLRQQDEIGQTGSEDNFAALETVNRKIAARQDVQREPVNPALTGNNSRYSQSDIKKYIYLPVSSGFAWHWAPYKPELAERCATPERPFVERPQTVWSAF